MAAVKTTMQAQVIYRTEYILRVKTLMKHEDLDDIRDEFLGYLRAGVAFSTPNVEVEAHQQPIAIVLSDDTIVRLEANHADIM